MKATFLFRTASACAGITVVSSGTDVGSRLPVLLLISRAQLIPPAVRKSVIILSLLATTIFASLFTASNLIRYSILLN